jgi:hypothetical protein
VPLPPSVISANTVICETILTEDSGVVSAIRIVDVFQYVRHPTVPLEQQVITVRILGIVRTKIGDTAEHIIGVNVLRPDEEHGEIHEVFRGPMPTKVPEAPGGFTVQAVVGVVPRKQGTHYGIVYFDGVEVARTPFTLVELPVEIQK